MFFQGRGLLCTAPVCLALTRAANERTGVISGAPATTLFVSEGDVCKVEGSALQQSPSAFSSRQQDRLHRIELFP